MFGFRFEIVRPRDWMGTMALLLVRGILLVLAIAALLGRLPPGWVEAVDGSTWVIRSVLLFTLLALSGIALRFMSLFVPTSPLLWRNHLYWRVGGRSYRRRLPIEEIEAVAIESRRSPIQDVLVIELKDGSCFDLCPITWDGAPRLFHALEKACSGESKANLVSDESASE